MANCNVLAERAENSGRFCGAERYFNVEVKQSYFHVLLVVMLLMRGLCKRVTVGS